MLLRLWILLLLARLLQYVPIIGWRFSDSIWQQLEARYEQDVTIGEARLELDPGSTRTLHAEIPVDNELPVGLDVTAVNLRVGATETGETLVNLVWAEDANGPSPGNLTTPAIEPGTADALEFERALPAAVDSRVFVDGSITTLAWVDVPSVKRLPLGSLDREVRSACVDAGE